MSSKNKLNFFCKTLDKPIDLCYYGIWMRTLRLHFDGSISNPNPGGNAAWGFYITDNMEVVAEGTGPLAGNPLISNNYAELFALHKGLEKVKEIVSQSEEKYQLMVFGDSQLVINIMTKKWGIDPEKLYYPAYLMARDSCVYIRKKNILVSFDWIPREYNTKADELSRWQQYELVH